MSVVAIIGPDLANRICQGHGARNDESVVFRKKVLQSHVLAFFAQQRHERGASFPPPL